MTTDGSSRVRIRSVRAKLVTGASAAALEDELNAFFETAGEKVMVGEPLQVGELAVLIVYAE